jgi:hypothetical protein
MGEQVLLIDPKTGKRRAQPPSADSFQNDGYEAQNDRHLRSRDFSRPGSIPADEFEATTGRKHSEAVAEWEQQQRESSPDYVPPADNPAPVDSPAPPDPVI